MFQQLLQAPSDHGIDQDPDTDSAQEDDQAEYGLDHRLLLL